MLGQIASAKKPGFLSRLAEAEKGIAERKNTAATSVAAEKPKVKNGAASEPVRLSTEDRQFITMCEVLGRIALSPLVAENLRRIGNQQQKWLAYAMTDLDILSFTLPEIPKVQEFSADYLSGKQVGRREISKMLPKLDQAQQQMQRVRGQYRNLAQPKHAPLPSEFVNYLDACSGASRFLNALSARLEAGLPPPSSEAAVIGTTAPAAKAVATASP